MSSTENPFAALQRVFHEPNRMAIVSALAATEDGLPFVELKDMCRLTDGNLNRHLKALEDDGIITQKRDSQPDGGRPRTNVTLTAAGRRRFVKYLESLEAVLAQAAASVSADSKSRRTPAPGTLVSRPARA